MTTYRVRPAQVVEVEAIRWTGDNTEEVRAFIGPRMTAQEQPHGTLYIEFYGGFTIPSRGDWIVRKPGATSVSHVDADTFERTYEPASRAAGSSAPAFAPGEHPCDACGRPTKMEPDTASGIIECAECICRNAGIDPVASWDRIRARIKTEHGIDLPPAAGSSAPREEPEDVDCWACIREKEGAPDGQAGPHFCRRPSGHADEPGADPRDEDLRLAPVATAAMIEARAREEGRRDGIEEVVRHLTEKCAGTWSVGEIAAEVRSLSSRSGGDGGGTKGGR